MIDVAAENGPPDRTTHFEEPRAPSTFFRHPPLQPGLCIASRSSRGGCRPATPGLTEAGWGRVVKARFAGLDHRSRWSVVSSRLSVRPPLGPLCLCGEAPPAAGRRSGSSDTRIRLAAPWPWRPSPRQRHGVLRAGQSPKWMDWMSARRISMIFRLPEVGYAARIFRLSGRTSWTWAE